MDGYIHIMGVDSRDVADVVVVLYEADRTVIDRVSVGGVSRYPEGPHPTEQPVNVTTDRLPTYVIIESPDIWSNGVPSEAFRWNGDEYAEYWVVNEKERFPAS